MVESNFFFSQRNTTSVRTQFSTRKMSIEKIKLAIIGTICISDRERMSIFFIYWTAIITYA